MVCLRIILELTHLPLSNRSPSAAELCSFPSDYVTSSLQNLSLLYPFSPRWSHSVPKLRLTERRLGVTLSIPALRG